MARTTGRSGFKMRSGNKPSMSRLAGISPMKKIVEGRDQKDDRGMYKTLINKKTGEIRKDYADGFVITKKGKGDVQPRTKANFSDWTRIDSEKKKKARDKEVGESDIQNF